MGLDMDRYQGCLQGLAVGDALGTTVEFKAPGTFVPMEDIIGGGVFELLPGQWTDDTSMALCLAESLLAKQGFDAADQMQRYTEWFREGYLSSTGNASISATLRGRHCSISRTRGSLQRIGGSPFSRERLDHAPGTGGHVLCAASCSCHRLCGTQFKDNPCRRRVSKRMPPDGRLHPRRAAWLAQGRNAGP